MEKNCLEFAAIYSVISMKSQSFSGTEHALDFDVK